MAFWLCENLKSINLGGSISSIGSNVFYGTKWLDEKRKENPLVIVNGILIDGSNCKGDVIIPDTVTHINANSFSGVKTITSVKIPNSVKSIGSATFHASSIVTVKMENSVETIEADAFRWCTKLKNVRLSNSLTRLESGTFSYCHQLKNITIPESVEYIDSSAFFDCGRLSYVTISERLAKLDNESEFSGRRATKDILTIYVSDKEKPCYIVDVAKRKNYPLCELELQTKKITLQPGESYELRMNSYAKCDSWKSSNKSVASVNYYGRITAKKKGTAVITTTLYGKEYKCTIIVK